MTSGGSGIAHSEFNADRNPDGKDAHFLQIWALPYERNLKPQYYAREFSDEEKKDKWAHIVAPAKSTEFGVIDKRDASGPTPIHSAVNTFATLLSPAATVDHALVSRLVPDATNVKKVYLQVVQTTAYNPNAAVKDGAVAALVKVSLGGQEATLGEGDGVFIDGATVGENLVLENVSSKVAEVLLFEMD
jgi:redox-sensitive bicupin YhaK (pirin superfamily)